MQKLPIHKPDGSKSGTIDLPESLFGAKINPQLMAQAVRIYLSNQRKAHAKTKTRGEINLTTKKWYRQKGTGRARHGAKSAPIFVGGAKAHGPRGNQNYRLELPQKMRRAALASALTSKLADQQVFVVDGLENLKPKTKLAAQALYKLKLADQNKLTLITDQKIESIQRAFRNLPTVSLQYANQLHAYLVLNGGALIFTKEAINQLEQTFVTKSQQQQSANASVSSVAKPAQTNKKATTKKAKGTPTKSAKTSTVSTKTKPTTKNKTRQSTRKTAKRSATSTQKKSSTKSNGTTNKTTKSKITKSKDTAKRKI